MLWSKREQNPPDRPIIASLHPSSSLRRPLVTLDPQSTVSPPLRGHLDPSSSSTLIPSNAEMPAIDIARKIMPNRETRPPTPPSADSYPQPDAIYLGLSTFTFGTARPSAPQIFFDANVKTDNQISPLTPIPDPGSDRTPRPSVSIPSDRINHGKYFTSDSLTLASPLPPPPRRHRAPPLREEHMSDSDDAHAEILLSDTASQHTFGGHNINSSSASLSSLDTSSHSHTGFSSDEDGGMYYHTVSPTNILPHPSLVCGDTEDDEDGDAAGLTHLPKDHFYNRRRSLPMAIPGASTAGDSSTAGGQGGREREASLLTVRRPSRSLDDEIRSLNLALGPGGTSEPLSKGDWATLEARSDDGQAAYQNAGININYILGGPDTGFSRRSSGALSFAQPVRRPSHASQMMAFGWGWNGPARRPSTATIGTAMDDTFSRHLRGWDEEYGMQKGFWSFKRERADGSTRLPSGSAAGSILSQTSNTDDSSEVKFKSKDAAKESGKTSGDARGMALGTQEIWMCELVGRFKVDRTEYKADASKPPHQRLNIRHILDPYSIGNTRGGPSITIHKHSRAVAFSIYRAYNLARHHRIRPGILLGPKKVQERFTSTKTTAKLATHGLLKDGDSEREPKHSGRSGVPSKASSTSRKYRETEKSKSEDTRTTHRTGEEQSRPGTASETTRVGSDGSPKDRLDVPDIVKVVPRPLDNLLIAESPNSESNELLVHLSRLESISDQSTVKSVRAYRNDSFDSELLPASTRTPHSETYGTLDSSLIEYVRARPDHHRTTELDAGTSFLRRLLRPLPRSTTPGPGVTAGQTSAQLEGNYKPPWMAMAPRAKQEETDRVIHNLNNSFKGVGLLPANTKPTQRNKHSGSQVNSGRNELLDGVPDDSLFMLLPLWPGETDLPSAGEREAVNPLAPALDERNYLLVYYVAFGQKEPERGKKKIRHSQSPSVDARRSANPQDDRSIILTEFHVAARLVGYNELRGSGVRLASDGLSVTGPMWEAAQSVPDSTTRLQSHGDVGIAVYHSRERGIEFFPDGLLKMGLCLPVAPRSPSIEVGGKETVSDVVVPQLSPVGRAALEMVWAGCMALSSFGPS